jgi:hypothetical protein
MHLLSSLEIYSAALFPELNDREDDIPLWKVKSSFKLVWMESASPCNSRIGHMLKGHGNEADFLGFLQKAVRHRLFTLHF